MGTQIKKSKHEEREKLLQSVSELPLEEYEPGLDAGTPFSEAIKNNQDSMRTASTDITPVGTDEKARHRLLKMFREVFLQSVKASYGKQVNDGVLPDTHGQATHLMNSCDVALDFVRDGMMDWTYLKMHLSKKWSKMRLLSFILHHCEPPPHSSSTTGWLWQALNNKYARWDVQWQEHICYVISCFLEAHKS